MLPTQKTPPRTLLTSLTALLYGATKLGKSTFCAQAAGVLFLATEPGLNHLDVFQVPIRSWEDLLVAGRELADGKHPFKTVVIDTIDNAYRFCVEHHLKKLGVEHESDVPFGKAYALIQGEFHRVLTRFAQLPYGLFLISHAQEKEVETRTGTLTRIVPSLPDKARQTVLGLVDLVLFADFDVTTAEGKRTSRRVLRTKPTAQHDAGDRTGRLPEVIEMEFRTFAAAFERGATRSTP
jgi:hypothetical protein